MRYGEVCAGYDGLGKAIAMVFGATPAWFSEFDEHPSRILKFHYPDVPNYGDMTIIPWADIEQVDILSGGTPCQDLSHAGRRKGMTDGTRSNLWVHMREGIAIQRPEWVVWENVRGAYSACADSEADSHLGRCPRCVDPTSGAAHNPNLRALGRVLGDLASLGYDAQWRGIRASDVGAPHGRYRVFVLARRRSLDRNPNVQDVERSGTAGRTNPDQEQSTRPDRGTGHGPTTNTSGDGRERRKSQQGNGRNPRLRGEAIDHPRDGSASQATPHTDGLGHDRSGGGYSVAADAERDAGPGEGGRHPSGPEDRDGAPSESGRHSGVRPEPGRPENIEYTQWPPEPADYDSGPVNWGPYEPAIRRWERIHGYPVPRPTEPSGRSGKQRLSPYFTEWLMGQEPGWITDPAIWEGVSEGAARNAQLKAAGNGVVTLQAAVALAEMKRAFEAMDTTP